MTTRMIGRAIMVAIMIRRAITMIMRRIFDDSRLLALK